MAEKKATTKKKAAKKKTAKKSANQPPKRSGPGRPGWECTEERIEKARELADLGFFDMHIARALGISAERLVEKKKQYPELRKAIEEGREAGLRRATDAIRRKMESNEKGSLSAAIFYTKVHGKWRDNDTPTEQRGSESDSESASERILGRVRGRTKRGE